MRRWTVVTAVGCLVLAGAFVGGRAVGRSDGGSGDSLCGVVTPALVSEVTGWLRVGAASTTDIVPPGTCLFTLPDATVSVSLATPDEASALLEELADGTGKPRVEVQPAGESEILAETGRTRSVASTGTDFVVAELTWNDPTRREYPAGMESIALDIARALEPGNFPEPVRPTTEELDQYQAALAGLGDQSLAMCWQTAYVDTSASSVEISYTASIWDDTEHSATERIGHSWEGRVVLGRDMDLNGRCSDLLPLESPEVRSIWPIVGGTVSFEIRDGGPDGCHLITASFTNLVAERPDETEPVPLADLTLEARIPYAGVDGCYYPRLEES